MPFALHPMFWLLVGPAMLLALFAQWRVKSAFARWSREPVRAGVTGAEAAAIVLQDAGLHDVGIEESRGYLSDHYDPRAKVLRLSPDVYHGASVAAVGVAAHEAGHAIQDAEGYAALRMRSAIVPLASIGSWLSMPLILAGFVFQAAGLIQVGIVAFATIVAFQLITLPVEFDASARATRSLASVGLISGEREAAGVRSVLGAAALTYVAATLTAVAELLYYVLLFASHRDD